MTIQAGTFLTQVGLDRYRNRAWWFAPDGTRDYQDKLQLTGFEKDAGVIEGGDELKVRSEEHTSELQSLMRISYAVFCLKKKNTAQNHHNNKYQKSPTCQ